MPTRYDPLQYEPVRHRHILSEYSTVILPDETVTARDLAVLQELAHTGLLILRWLPGVWEVRAQAVVGVLTLDHLVLEIRPTSLVTGERVMTWLSFALGQPTPDEVSRRWATTPRGLADLVAAALVAECRLLLRDQLRRDYRRTHALEPVLRGRLDVAQQLTHRFGQVDRLHMRTFDRDVAVWENLACQAALRRAAHLASSPDLVRVAREVAACFPDCDADPPTVARWLATARYHRMNSRYRPAHTWAALLLGAGDLAGLLVEGSRRTPSLLVDMNRLWVAVVRRIAAAAADTIGGRPVRDGDESVITAHEPEHTIRVFRPDVLLRVRPDDPLPLPVDARYARYDQQAVHPVDVHQTLTYASGYQRGDGTRRAVVVYPAEFGSTRRSITVQPPTGRPSVIDLVGLDVRGSPHQAISDLTTALTTE